MNRDSNLKVYYNEKAFQTTLDDLRSALKRTEIANPDLYKKRQKLVREALKPHLELNK